jgi:demethylmenaquinone methyltransferase/2-methoxy-6-polyprenyl-1,4-benzoquinol methylase
MANLTGEARAQYVQELFGTIAHRYDLMNRLMTFGQDARWRREVIRAAGLSQNSKLLDLGAGTGDLEYEALQQVPSAQVVAVDFSLEMIWVGKAKNGPVRNIHWLAADALCLPFPEASFDAVISAFLLRNVADLRTTLQEQYRVLKPGGKIVTLDTSPPPHTPPAPFIRFHLHYVIPTLGKLVSNNAQAYHYLPDSTEAFLEPGILARYMQETGLHSVTYQRRMFGTIAIHQGVK